MIAKKKDIIANPAESEVSGATGEASQPRDAELSKEVAAARLCEAYRVAAEQGSFVFDQPLDVSLLISDYGRTQAVFPTLDGMGIGVQISIGLPNPCSYPKVIRAEKAGDSNNIWLTLSTADKSAVPRVSRILLINGKTGREAIKTEQVAQSDALTELLSEAYRLAKAQGSFVFDPPLDVSLLISRYGKTQVAFPLLDGQIVGDSCGIGLPSPCGRTQAIKTERADDPNNVWLTLSALDGKNVPQISRVLLIHDQIGREAIKTEQEVQSNALKELYRQVLSGVAVNCLPIDISLILSSDGCTQITFPLLDGQSIRGYYGTGLSHPCSRVQVTGIEKAANTNNVWLTLSALDKEGVAKRSCFLLIYGKTGREAIKTEQDIQSDALKELYGQVLSGSDQNEFPIDISLLIGRDGGTRAIFPLLDNQTIGYSCGIGLKNHRGGVRVIGAEKSTDSNNVWLTLSTRDEAGALRSSRVLVVYGKTGREAIKTEQDVQSDSLKEVFRQAIVGSVEKEIPLDISFLIGDDGQMKSSFPLLDGQTMGRSRAGIGLPKCCSCAQVIGVEKAPNSNNVWVTFSALDSSGFPRSSRVLLIYGKTGREAIKTEQDVQTDALKELYEQALSGRVITGLPLDISFLIGSNGAPLKNFPLLDGQTIGMIYGIGFPKAISCAQVIGADKANDSKDVWLTMSAVDKEGIARSARVLLIYGKTGRDAIKTEKDLQSDKLKDLYRQALSGSVAKGLPLDVSLLISEHGVTQIIFPLPGEHTIGDNYCVGLGPHSRAVKVVGIEKAMESNDLWLTLSALDKAGIPQTSRVLLVHGRTGRDAIRTEQDVQSDALKVAFQQVLCGSIATEFPIDISLLISGHGSTQMAFPLLAGQTIGKNCGVGLPSPCSHAQVVGARRAGDSNNVWLTLSALDKRGAPQFSRVLVIHGRRGREAIKTEQDVQSDTLKELYEQAVSSSVTKRLPLDISLLIGGNGTTRVVFPLPGGSTIGKTLGIGLPQDISHCQVTEILHLAEDRYCLTISGNLPSGVTASTQVVVSSSGIIRPVEIELGVEIAKGHTLDRYVAHLLAVGNIVGESNPLYHSSALTGERFMPNAVAGDTIVHSKWGNSGSDVLEYVQRYARLRLWNNGLRQALHLVATTKHLAELREAIEALEKHVSVNGTGITDIETWCSEIPGLDRATIHEELKRISVMASIGDIEWLRGRTYEPTLPSASRPQSPQSTAWQERVLRLAQGPELLEALKLHSKHHSLYWERSYHLDLVRHCSYLIDQALAISPLSEALKDEARQLVYQIYPELKRYPDAWRRLEEPGAELVETKEGGDGSPPYLVPFDLVRELARCGVKETVSLVPVNQIDWGHARDVGPKVHDLFRRYSRIEDALKQLLVELKGQPKDTCNSVSAACLEWIAAAVLDVRVLDRLPAGLNRAKGAADPTSVFIQELNKLSPETKLYYVSGQRELKIAAQQLKESLSNIEALGGLDNWASGQM